MSRPARIEANIWRTTPSKRHPKGLYQVRYKDNRNRSQKRSFSTLAEARRFRASVVTDKARGEFIDPARGSVLFEKVAETWRETLPLKRKPKTVAGYEWHLDRFVLPAFTGRKIGSISFADAEGFVQDQIAAGQGAASVRHSYFILKGVLDYAIKNSLIRHNPCAGVTLPKLPQTEMLFLTAEQVAALAEALPAMHGLIVKFAAYTGLRAGEIAALRIGDVVWERRTVTVTKTLSDVGGKLIEQEPKSKAARRTVPIPAFVFDELRAFVGERIVNKAAYLFPGGKNGTANLPWRQNNWYGYRFKPAVRTVFAGTELVGLRFHDLRHTYAALLVEQGAHPKEMAERMGHSTVQITLDRYSHLMPHLGDALAERMDAAYRDVQPSKVVANVTSLR